MKTINDSKSNKLNSYYGISQKGGDSQYKYLIFYINDILKQVRSGNTDYVYDIEKVLMLSAFEPNIIVLDYYDECYYVSIKNDKKIQKKVGGGE